MGRVSLARTRKTNRRRHACVGMVLLSGVAQIVSVVGGGGARERSPSITECQANPSMLWRRDLMPLTLKHDSALPVATEALIFGRERASNDRKM